MAKAVLSNSIINSLRERIIAGELRPGEPLTEERLAFDLSVSRTPIREALRQLSEEGFVELFPHRGARVIHPDSQFVREVLHVREALEGLAARGAATSIDASRLELLHDLFETLQGPVSRGDLSDIGEVIHDEILAACGNTRLQRLAQVYSKKSAWIRRIAEEIPGRLLRSFREHQGILCALAARDPEWSEVAMRSHIRSALGDILDSVSARDRRGTMDNSPKKRRNSRNHANNAVLH